MSISRLKSTLGRAVQVQTQSHWSVHDSSLLFHRDVNLDIVFKSELQLLHPWGRCHLWLHSVASTHFSNRKRNHQCSSSLKVSLIFMSYRERLRGSVRNYRTAKPNKIIENAKQQTTKHEVMGPHFEELIFLPPFYHSMVAIVLPSSQHRPEERWEETCLLQESRWVSAKVQMGLERPHRRHETSSRASRSMLKTSEFQEGCLWDKGIYIWMLWKN